MDEYMYILRFTVQPGHMEKDRIGGLVDFCRDAKIDDVMFFINSEELNDGHLTMEETAPWLEMISRAKPLLEAIGVTVSINPWSTLLHTDRGRVLKKGQRFTLMKDPAGREASAVACPMCPEWRAYIREMYRYYASVRPRMLWVEDDFRLHNHAPLSWGGCFCDRHMEVYSAAAGRKLTREEFIRGVLAVGEPHPFRKIWLDVSRDTMTTLARMIGDAVHEASPETRVGLMSSCPDVHCAEGRNWKGILRGLSSGTTPMVNRPHLPAYLEASPQGYLWNFNIVSQMTRAVVPETAELYPELENFQYSGFAKSANFTRFQLEGASCMNVCGITLNLFDQMGNGVLDGEGYRDALSRAKPFLSSIKRLNLLPGNRRGIRVLMSEESSFALRTYEGKRMEELYPAEGFWGGLLGCFGIASRFAADDAIENGVVAISGQYLRNLKEREIRRLFESGFVMLEGEAAYTLCDMGLGSLAGIADVRWRAQDGGFQSYEEVCGGLRICGIEKARMSAQVSAGDYLEIRYDRPPEILTVVKNARGETVGPGMAVHDRRALILPYGRFRGGCQAHQNPIRQELMQTVLMRLPAGECPAFVMGLPHVALYDFSDGSRRILMILNASGDDVKELGIYAPGCEGPFREIDRRTGKIADVDLRKNENCLMLADGVGNMELRVILCG